MLSSASADSVPPPRRIDAERVPRTEKPGPGLSRETFISVDVEASGPIPGEFSLLSIGACVVGHGRQQFYIELKPITSNHDPEALRVTGFDLDALAREGAEPALAMGAFEAWTSRVVPPDHRPVFVAYPLAFDWMFVAYYFHRFLQRNPFGVSGLDLASFCAGAVNHAGAAWTLSELEQKLDARLSLTHHALDDAVAQAAVCEDLLAYRGTAEP